VIRVGQIAKEYLEAGAMSSLIGLFGFVDEHTFLTKSGDLGVVFRVPGVDAECLDHAERDEIARRFKGAVRALDERFRVYQYLLKRDHPQIPHQHYENPVVEQAISNRIEFLRAKSNELYTLDVFFVMMYEGWHRGGAAASRLRYVVRRPQSAIPELLSAGKKLTIIQADLDRARELLANKATSFAIQLHDVLGIELLGRDAAFQFLRRLVNFASHKLHLRIKYNHHLDYFASDSALECYRDHLRIDDYFVQVLTLKEPPAQTFAHILEALEQIPCNYIIANEWSRESNLAARKEINSKRRHFHNSKASLMNYVSDQPVNSQEMLIDDGAAGLVTELGACLREIEINGNYFGKYSLTIVLYDQDRTKLRRSVAECFKLFSTYDAVLMEERYNLLNTFLSVIPGNRSYNLRRLWLLNTNYSDLSLLFTLHTGQTHNAHLDAEYLAVLKRIRRRPTSSICIIRTSPIR
jgi:type IV secretory pathway VirB4 component